VKKELKTEKSEKIREELYLTIFIMFLLVITSVLFSASISGFVTGIWLDIIAVLLFICLNILAIIIVLTIREWHKQRKREKSQYNNNETERKFSFCKMKEDNLQ